MSTYEQLQEALAVIRKHSALEPTVGVVLGSGLGAFADRVDDAVKIPYGDIPNMPSSTVVGHAGELILGRIGGVPTAVMSGRVHYYEGHSMEKVTFGVRLLAGLGIKKLILTNAAGAVNRHYKPGDFMIIVDHLNMTGDNPLRGTNDDRLGPRFPDMTAAYGEIGRRAIKQAAKGVDVEVHEGVYVGLAGPSYETPAEIRMLQTLAADAVGMSTVAEAIVASHAGLELGAMSVITNRAAGMGADKLSHEEVKEVGERVKGVLCDLLEQTVINLK